MFSGNPVTPDGWVMTKPTDVKFILRTGPFRLRKMNLWISGVFM